MPRLSARPRPNCSDAPSRAVAPARAPGPTGHPELTSPRVKRNRRLWATGLLALALVLVLLSTAAVAGTPRLRGRATAGRGITTGTPPPHAGNPRLDPDWDGDGQPGDARLRGRRPLPGRDQPRRPAGRRPLRRARADGAPAPLGRRPLHGQPGVGPDRRQVPRPPTQAVRLLRADLRHERLPGSGGDADHRGQQPRGGLRAGRPPDGAGRPGADRVHRSWASARMPRRRSPRTRRRSTASTSRSSPPPRSSTPTSRRRGRRPRPSPAWRPPTT